MPGMNLAQSAQPKGVGQYLGKGLIFVILSIVVVVAIWGGLSYYENQLIQDIADVEAQTTQARVNMTQDQIDSISDFQFRINNIVESGKSSQTEPMAVLESVEGAILPGITLSNYSYNVTQKTVDLVGESDSFRTIVQQLTVLKKLPDFKDLSVSKLERNDVGRINFAFIIAL